METLVFDTAAVLNFGQRGNLEFLLQKFSRQHAVITTPEVVAELTDPEQQAFYCRFLKTHFAVRPVSAMPLDVATLAHLSRTIDPGEISVMALAQELGGHAVLDDKAARRESARLGIQITGTVGLLHHAVKKKWLTEPQCLTHITQLCNADFKIPRPGPNQTFAEYIRQLP